MERKPHQRWVQVELKVKMSLYWGEKMRWSCSCCQSPVLLLQVRQGGHGAWRHQLEAASQLGIFANDLIRAKPFVGGLGRCSLGPSPSHSLQSLLPKPSLQAGCCPPAEPTGPLAAGGEARERVGLSLRVSSHPEPAVPMCCARGRAAAHPWCHPSHDPAVWHRLACTQGWGQLAGDPRPCRAHPHRLHPQACSEPNTTCDAGQGGGRGGGGQ